VESRSGVESSGVEGERLNKFSKMVKQQLKPFSCLMSLPPSLTPCFLAFLQVKTSAGNNNKMNENGNKLYVYAIILILKYTFYNVDMIIINFIFH
jgi:hypothetical protein